MNLRRAITLYRFVKDHIPQDVDKLQINEYLRKIVSSIRSNGNKGDFSHFFFLVTGMELDKIEQEKATELLLIGMIDADLQNLQKFLEGINHG